MAVPLDARMSTPSCFRPPLRGAPQVSQNLQVAGTGNDASVAVADEVPDAGGVTAFCGAAAAAVVRIAAVAASITPEAGSCRLR